MNNKRIIYIDNIKGLACLLVLFAHFIPDDVSQIFLNYLQFLAGVTPVLFLSIFAVTLFLQLEKRTMVEIFGNYLVLLLFSTALNGITTSKYLFFNNQNIVMMIAIFAIFSIFVLYLTKLFTKNTLKSLNKKLALLATIAIYLLFRLIYQFYEIPIEGFNFLPWYGFFIYGLFIDKLSLKENVLIVVMLASAFFFTTSNKWAFFDHGEDTFKWFMSPSYFLYAILTISSVFLLMKFIFRNKEIILINFFGQNTLLFWIIQYLVFFKIEIIKNLSTTMYFLSALLITFLLMKVLLLMKKTKIFTLIAKNKKSHVLLILALIVNSFLNKKLSINISYLLFIYFSLTYKYIYNDVNKLLTNKK